MSAQKAKELLDKIISVFEEQKCELISRTRLVTCFKCSFNHRTEISNSTLTKNLNNDIICPTCAFIIKVKAVHGDKYDYSKTIFTKLKEKITVICNTCNSEFTQEACNHANGCEGCPNRCSLKKNKEGDDKKEKPLYTAAQLRIIKELEEQNCKFVAFVPDMQECFVCERGHENTISVATHRKKRTKNVLYCAICEYIDKGEKLYGKGRYNYDKVKNITANNTITIACCRCKCEFDTTTAKHYNGSDSKCINKACK